MHRPEVQNVRRDELAVVQIDGPRAQIAAAAQGAHLFTWSTAGTERPVLYLSPRSVFKTGKAIRGGVPLCFPWFGPNPDDPRAPQHGFARTRDWTVESAVVAPDGTARLAFALAPDASTRAAWPHDFAARFLIEAGEILSLALEVRNTGTTALTFGAALHTYLAVSDVRGIALRGLERTHYLDKVAGGSERRREGDAPVTFSGETDRVYLDTTATCTIDDPGWRRRIRVSKTGSRSTVVWNPWIDKARGMADLGEDAWPGFVCVETCNAADDVVTLAPGASHTLGAEIDVAAC